MLDSPVPQDEQQRLQTLRSLGLLDTEPEERFDRIIRMAARLFNMPIAIFSLIDRDRLWFKSRLGFAAREYPRAESICAHTILQDDVLVVPNPAEDVRFSAIPALHGPDPIRFYAGVPVKAPDRATIGTLCMADTRPRRLDAAQRALLADLAATIESEVAAGALVRAMKIQRDNEISMTGLLNKLPEGFLLLDAEGTVLSANPAAERLFGAGPAGLVEHKASDLLSTQIGPLLRQVREGAGSQLQATARCLNGATFAAEFSASMVHMGHSERYVVIVRDVTSRRESERRDRATDARRRKYFFTATNEMRTPMASVVGFTELLLKRDFSTDSMREFVGIIHAQSTRLVKLINEMLDLARIETGGSEALEIRACDAEALVEETLAGIDGKEFRGPIRHRSAPGVPAVLGDGAKLQQALLNIIGNAIKYSPPQAPIDIAIDTAVLEGRPAVALRVRDQGAGMSAEQQEHAFEPFYRAGDRRDVVGSGLGLTIVKEIVELHAGTVQLTSAPGAGTTVTVLLPAAPR
jgi:PAS domain S-box-containing protein